MKKFLKNTLLCLFFTAVVACATLVTAGLYLERSIEDPTEPSAVGVLLETRVVQSDESMSDMLSALLPSVVGIGGSEKGTGSGVIATESGYIITNHHVIDDSQRLYVTLYDGTICEAKKIWSDAALDLAVIRVYGKTLSAAPLGSIDSLRVGESVAAIGNPLGMQFERSVTKGIVSAMGRSISVVGGARMDDLIQTDASINAGNSGGPLVNMRGEVIGINTVKVEGAEGMGFAVPIDICAVVISMIESRGAFETPDIGLEGVSARTARYQKQDFDFPDGVFVSALDPQGSAFEAGIRYGDIITHIDGKSTTCMMHLREALFRFQKGDSVTVRYVRASARLEASIAIK